MKLTFKKIHLVEFSFANWRQPFRVPCFFVVFNWVRFHLPLQACEAVKSVAVVTFAKRLTVLFSTLLNTRSGGCISVCGCGVFVRERERESAHAYEGR